jgi:surface carbohydrate biosynthesis protein
MGRAIRDIPGHALIAMALCELGHTVYILSGSKKARPEVWALAPDFVLLDGHRTGDVPFARELLEAGIPYALLEAEGGPMDSYTDWQLQDDKTRRKALAHFTWGKQQKKILVNHNLYDQETVAVTGQPRFDFYFPPWRDALQKENMDDLDQRPIFLFTTKFISNQLSREEELVSAERRAQNWRNVDIDEMIHQYDTSAKSMKLFTPLAINVAKRFPGARIILRPHPYEKLDAYDSYMENAPNNIEVNRDRSVTDWLLQSTATIKLSCITAFEAAFAGIPNFTPTWIPDGAPVPEAQRISIKIPSEEALFDALEKCLDNEYLPPDEIVENTQDAIKQWFHHPDGKAHLRVSAEILARYNRIKDGSTNHHKNCLAHLYGLKSNGVRSKGIKSYARYLLGIPPQFNIRQWKISSPSELLDAKRADIGLIEHYLKAAEQGLRSTGETVLPKTVRRANSANDYIITYKGNAVAIAPA